MAQTLTAQRFGQLLRTDLLFIINFIVGNNPNAVADNIAALSIDRPSTSKATGDALNYLLNAGRGNDFVQALNVPLNVDQLSPDQQVQLYAAAGNNSDSSTAARNLAVKALEIWEMTPADAVTDPTTKRVQPVNEQPATPKPPMDPDKKRTLTRLIWGGVAVVVFIIAVAVAVRVIKAS